MRPHHNEPAYLVYDAACALCSDWAGWVERRSGHAFRLTPAAGARATLERLDPEAVDRSLWIVGKDQEPLGGAAAVNEILRVIGGPWRLLSLAGRFEVARRVEERIYRLVARHRRHLAWAAFNPRTR